jgi:hypothetical protein
MLPLETLGLEPADREIESTFRIPLRAFLADSVGTSPGPLKQIIFKNLKK